MNSAGPITVPVKLDSKTFKRFAWFDMFTLRKRWKRPVLFSFMLIAFAVIALLTGKSQSGLIAAVLLAVGIGLPVIYFGSFLSQVSAQAEDRRLEPPRRVYTVTLGGKHLAVENNQKKEETLILNWKDVPQAYRVKGCIYLYVSPAKAFLLPDGQADVPDNEVWEYLVKHMGAQKCQNRRKGK